MKPLYIATVAEMRLAYRHGLMVGAARASVVWVIICILVAGLMVRLSQ